MGTGDRWQALEPEGCYETYPFIPAQCPYCSMNTAGEHEVNCPNRHTYHPCDSCMTATNYEYQVKRACEAEKEVERLQIALHGAQKVVASAYEEDIVLRTLSFELEKIIREK